MFCCVSLRTSTRNTTIKKRVLININLWFLIAVRYVICSISEDESFSILLGSSYTSHWNSAVPVFLTLRSITFGCTPIPSALLLFALHSWRFCLKCWRKGLLAKYSENVYMQVISRRCFLRERGCQLSRLFHWKCGLAQRGRVWSARQLGILSRKNNIFFFFVEHFFQKSIKTLERWLFVFRILFLRGKKWRRGRSDFILPLYFSRGIWRGRRDPPQQL